MEATAKYIVEGMTCSSCVNAVKSTLEAQDGISNVRVDLTTKLVVLDQEESAPEVAKLKAILKSKGYELNELPAETTTSDHESMSVHAGNRFEINPYLKHSVMGLALLPIAYLHYLTHHHGGPALIEWISTVIIMLLANDLLMKGLKRLFSRHQTMESLIVLSALAAISYSLFSTLWPNMLEAYKLMPTSYLDGPTIAIVFVSIGKWIESGAIRQTGMALKDLDKALPNQAMKKTASGIEQVSTSSLEKGDLILVKAGTHIPVDGLIVSGESTISMQAITGESMPLVVGKGEKVFAGGINHDGVLEVEVTAKQGQTMLGQMITTLQETRMKKAAPQQMADQIAAWFVPLVIGVAVLAALSWVVIGQLVDSQYMTLDVVSSTEEAYAMAIGTFIGVLVVACPCALGLATPLVVVKAVGLAAKEGILVKDLELLSKSENVTDVIFDKTGTLTVGQPTVTDVEVSPKVDIGMLQAIADLVSQHDNHPLIQGLGRWAKEHKTTFSNLKLDGLTLISGKGLLASISLDSSLDRKQLVIGNQSFIKEQGLLVSPRFTKFINEHLTKSLLLIGLDGAVIAAFALRDEPKPEASGMLSTLRERGLKTHILSGDKQEVVDELAEQLGFDVGSSDIRGGLSPQQKYEAVKTFQESGKTVLMLGDGINDSLAMQQADCSLAIGYGADLAKQTAMGVLLSLRMDILTRLPELSQQYNQRIKENLWWAFGYNITMLPMASGAVSALLGINIGHGWAGIAMAMSSLTVVLNAQRIGLKQKGS